jgi:bacillithiol system protein YtxJ
LKVNEFLSYFTKNKGNKMDWINLNKVEQLIEIDNNSLDKIQIIFKHSTRCSVSIFAKRILSREYSDKIKSEADIYYLDLIEFREVSNAVAKHYKVVHESPQILVVNNKNCTYSASHSDVSFKNAF